MSRGFDAMPVPPPWGPAITSPDQIIVGDPSTGAPIVLSPGSPGQVLTLDAGTGHIAWEAVPTPPPPADDDHALPGPVTITGDASGNPALVVLRGSVPSGDIVQIKSGATFLVRVDISGNVTIPTGGLTVAGNTNLQFTQFGPTGSVHMTVMSGGDTLALFNAGVEQAALDISHGPLPYLMLNSSKLFMASGDPTSHSLSGVANSGDLYIRTDTPTTANQRLYMCTGVGTWTALI